MIDLEPTHGFFTFANVLGNALQAGYFKPLSVQPASLGVRLAGAIHDPRFTLAEHFRGDKFARRYLTFSSAVARNFFKVIADDLAFDALAKEASKVRKRLQWFEPDQPSRKAMGTMIQGWRAVFQLFKINRIWWANDPSNAKQRILKKLREMEAGFWGSCSFAAEKPQELPSKDKVSKVQGFKDKVLKNKLSEEKGSKDKVFSSKVFEEDTFEDEESLSVAPDTTAVCRRHVYSIRDDFAALLRGNLRVSLFSIFDLHDIEHLLGFLSQLH